MGRGKLVKADVADELGGAKVPVYCDEKDVDRRWPSAASESGRRLVCVPSAEAVGLCTLPMTVKP
jgi:hypothetical protein